ncbi:hypothetical protein C9374_009080 [Naegleria lovaniensis]|uniref:F-box domain-containing protein n=1 Tax=Naegleria lovaniensis TaxID=51637 RepID=A0AA88KK77_NAELO|nr:uncharacterized protein C9374_009080 [Naegleria lovaniensis]KAG2377564.1 hypothetical protein C9374_009080 [Naegleria lovaniensis]
MGWDENYLLVNYRTAHKQLEELLANAPILQKVATLPESLEVIENENNYKEEDEDDQETKKQRNLYQLLDTAADFVDEQLSKFGHFHITSFSNHSHRFEEKFARYLGMENKEHVYPPLNTSLHKLSNLWEKYYDGDYMFFGIHYYYRRRVNIAELSQLCNHSTEIPTSLLDHCFNIFMNKPKLLEPKQKKVKYFTLYANETREEKWKRKYSNTIYLFNEILEKYNSKNVIASLFEKPPLSNEPSITTVNNREFLIDDYWITIMEFIEDPFTLLRLARTCKQFFNLYSEREVDLWIGLKKDIGLAMSAWV